MSTSGAVTSTDNPACTSTSACDITSIEASVKVRIVSRVCDHSRYVGSPGGYDQNLTPCTSSLSNRILVPCMYSQCSWIVWLYTFTQPVCASNKSMNAVVGALGPRQIRGFVLWIVFVSASSETPSIVWKSISASLNESGCSQSTLVTSGTPEGSMRTAEVDVPSRRSPEE